MLLLCTILPAVHPRDRRAADLGLRKAHEVSDGRGLPRPVGAQETVALSLFDLHRDIKNTTAIAVVLRQMFYCDDGHISVPLALSNNLLYDDYNREKKTHQPTDVTGLVG